MVRHATDILRGSQACFITLATALLAFAQSGLAQDHWAAARDFERQGQWAAAAEQWAAYIAANTPTNITSQDAALRAGLALERVGRFTDAIPFYDKAIAIADARTQEPRSKRTQLRRIKREAVFARARALATAGNPSASAEAYEAGLQGILNDLTFETQAEYVNPDNAAHLLGWANWAGGYLEGRDDPARAILIYDKVVAVGDRDIVGALGSTVRAILGGKRDALVKKAAVCFRQGCIEDARTALEQIRREFPGAVAPGGDESAEAAALQVAREEQAAAMLEQASRSGDPENVLTTADQVIGQFPESSAVLNALELKARTLEGLKRFDEAETAYRSMLDLLRPTAAESELFKTTRVRLMTTLAGAITTNRRILIPAPADRCEKLRAVCQEIIAQDDRPGEVAWAWIRLAQAYLWQRQFEDTLDVAATFLAGLGAGDTGGPVVEMHYIAALAQQELGLYDDSRPHLRWIIEESGLRPEVAEDRPFLAAAYRRVWCALVLSGADASALQTIADEYVSTFPDNPQGPSRWRLPPGARR